MNYNLKDIFEDISNLELEGALNLYFKEKVDHLWKWMLFDKENNHLNQALQIHQPSGVPIESRKTSLDPKLTVEGDFLLFDFIEHQPAYHLRKFESVLDVAKRMLNKSGIFNLFTAVQFPVIKGKLLASKDFIQLLEEEYEPTRLEWDLIEDLQNIIYKLEEYSNFQQIADEGRICLINYKNKGLQQQEAYDMILKLKIVYQMLNILAAEDLVDEILDYISGYFGNSKLWIWDKKL